MGNDLPVQAPLKVVGRYALHGMLAAGGMAAVHLGRLTGPAGFSRTVAIKRLHPQFARDPEFVAMFLDEARLAARIRHPNVVATLDVVAQDDELFLVMEYVRGESFSRLLRVCRRNQLPVPPRIITSVVVGMLHGLHAAHEATDEQGQPLHIVHRDVSPQNVIVGVDGGARVLDFGVAKAAARVQVTRDGQMKGKLTYMSPEQLRGVGVDRRSDLFAAGIVLWEALTGRRLFDADEPGAILDMILRHPVPPPSTLAPEVPGVFDIIVARALARDPAERFQTARELAIDLEDALALASPREVGDWVQATAGPLLHEREDMVAELEAVSAVSEPSLKSDSAPALMRSLGLDRAGAAVSSEANQWDEAPTSVIDLSSSRGAELSTEVEVPRPGAVKLGDVMDFEGEETTVYDPTIDDFISEASPESLSDDFISQASAEAALDDFISEVSAELVSDDLTSETSVEFASDDLASEPSAAPVSERARAQDAVARQVVARPRSSSSISSPAARRRRLLQAGAVGAFFVFASVFVVGRYLAGKVAHSSAVSAGSTASAAAPLGSGAASAVASSDLVEIAAPGRTADAGHGSSDGGDAAEIPEGEEGRPSDAGVLEVRSGPGSAADEGTSLMVQTAPPTRPLAAPKRPSRATRASSRASNAGEATRPPKAATAPASDDSTVKLDFSNPYAAPKPPAPSGRPAPKPGSDCSVPYFVDDQGIRRVRPECL
jgi:serine/threonine protein kinase